MSDTLSQIKLVIQSLTSDEDFQQDLWLHYLSGNPESTFLSHLRYLEQQRVIEQNSSFIANNVWMFFKQNPNNLCLESFTAFERSIICLLAIGCSVDDICNYKNISKNRIQQSICTIAKNKLWYNTFNGAKT